MIAPGLVIYASDIEASRAFYRDVLGLTLEERDDGFTARLQNLELHVEGGARPRKRGRRWMEEATAYVRISTDDFESLYFALEDRGAAFLGGLTVGVDGRRYAGLADPDGILIELQEVA